MAWLDPRFPMHPKVVELTDAAFRLHVSAICYSDGFGMRGKLTESQQQMVAQKHGPKIKTLRGELVTAGLWHLDKDGSTITIHGWQEYNDRRDRERERAKERQRRHRLAQREENE